MMMILSSRFWLLWISFQKAAPPLDLELWMGTVYPINCGGGETQLRDTYSVGQN